MVPVRCATPPAWGRPSTALAAVNAVAAVAASAELTMKDLRENGVTLSYLEAQDVSQSRRRWLASDAVVNRPPELADRYRDSGVHAGEAFAQPFEEASAAGRYSLTMTPRMTASKCVSASTLAIATHIRNEVIEGNVRPADAADRGVLGGTLLGQTGLRTSRGRVARQWPTNNS